MYGRLAWAQNQELHWAREFPRHPYFITATKKLQDFWVSLKTLNDQKPLCTNDVYSDEVIPGPQVLGQGALDGTAYIRKASES